MYIIDRLEDGFAVAECDGEMLDIPLAQLPEGVNEGDMLKKTEYGWELDTAAMEERRARLAARRKRMLGGGTA